MDDDGQSGHGDDGNGDSSSREAAAVDDVGQSGHGDDENGDSSSLFLVDGTLNPTSAFSLTGTFDGQLKQLFSETVCT